MFYSLDLYLDPLATVSSRGCVSCMRLTIQRGNCSANDVNAGGHAGTPGWFATRLDLQEEQALGSPTEGGMHVNSIGHAISLH